MIFKVLTAWMLAAATVAAPSMAAAQVQNGAAGADTLVELISLQTASDRMNAELDQVVRAAVARGTAERRSMSAGRPIQSYMENLEAAIMAEEAPSAGTTVPPLEAADIPPLIEKHLLLMEELERENLAQDAAARGDVETYAGAKSNGVAIKLRTASAIEAWGRLVVIIPPGEVIENDPIDVAHARLEDLTRRREELQAQLKTKPDSLGMRSILLALAGIDRQINAAIYQITGVVWLSRAGKGSICHPAAVKGRPVAWYNCDYWAENTPFVVDPSGENIIVDRVLIDVAEDASGLRSARIAYYIRTQGQPPSEESAGGASGDFRHMVDGSVQLIVKEIDSSGEERERAYPIELTTDEGRGLLPGFASHGPFKLKFKRDPKAYISFEEAQAASRGVVHAGSGGARSAGPSPGSPDDDNLVPLVGPGSTPPSPPEPVAPDEDGLIPLVGPGSAPPLPPPAPGSPEDDYLAPLTAPN